MAQKTQGELHQFLAIVLLAILVAIPGEETIRNVTQLLEQYLSGERRNPELYLTRFQNEQAKVADAPEESIQTLLIVGIKPNTELWKEVQSKDHLSLAKFYQMVAKHQRVESSLVALARSSLRRALDRSHDCPLDKQKGQDCNDRDQNRSQKRQGTDNHGDRQPLPRYVEYAPLTQDIAHIYEVSCEAKGLPTPERIRRLWVEEIGKNIVDTTETSGTIPMSVEL